MKDHMPDLIAALRPKADNEFYHRARLMKHRQEWPELWTVLDKMVYDYEEELRQLRLKLSPE